MPRPALFDRAMSATERSARRRRRESLIRQRAIQVVAAYYGSASRMRLSVLIEDLREALDGEDMAPS
jgi:hypothetical protein